MAKKDWNELTSECCSLLNLATAPIAITFSEEAPPGVPAFEGIMAEPSSDGRTGMVPAGCVFWMEAADKTFTTIPEHHGNCSVGSVTHGLKTLDEVAGNADVAAMLECGWVSKDVMPQIPSLKSKPNYITYGPLKDTTLDPDVILLRVNAKQAMALHAAVSDLGVEGKPQCHIIPLAKQDDRVSMSVGCTLSRVRTGMTNNEMTCAIPATRFSEVVDLLRTSCEADKAVSRYAADDSKRFERWNRSH